MTQAAPQTPPSKPHDSKQFFWRLLLTASLIAAVVSWLTTGMGLDRYVSMPLAWSMATAVQLGLFGLAWLIGSGKDVRRWWISSLYLLTMLFSVTFSYVTLQSELTKEIRPAEARRQLFDVSRQHLAQAQRQAQVGLQHSADLQLRLTSWLDMERRNGWATRTCEQEEHCYLEGVCDRIGRRIAQWEQESGRTYREGPGEQLIFGTLQTELRTLEQLGTRLSTYQESLTQSTALDADIDNRERLQRLDAVLNQAPLADLEAVSCQAVLPPTPPSYGDHARDVASRDEQPVYAFQDLVSIWHREGPLQTEDYPTLFALALALFIDLFVLVVALGAATLRQPTGARHLSFDDPAPSLDAALHRDMDLWIDGALLEERHDPLARRQFLTHLVRTLRLTPDGSVHLVPTDETQRRFGQLLMQSGAARLESFIKYHRVGRLFVLDGWVYAALCRHLGVMPPQVASEEPVQEGEGAPGTLDKPLPAL